MKTVNVEIFGQDEKLNKSIEAARSASMTAIPLLIWGESGVGKKTLARFIHENSRRSEELFEVVECSGHQESVAELILGYRDLEMGRFNKGVLERGNGGTVVFSNIDALHEDFQIRLQKILSELSDYDLDVRLVATTTKNLSKLVSSGRFQSNLYSVFSQTMITMPPLRERPKDIEFLANYFANQFSINEHVEIQKEAMDKILGHYWAHNIHELKAVMENSTSDEEHGVLMDIDLEINDKRPIHVTLESDNEGIRLMSLKEAERILIKKALIHTSENRTQAAKILGVSIRTLRNKINEYRSSGNTYFVNLR